MKLTTCGHEHTRDCDYINMVGNNNNWKLWDVKPYCYLVFLHSVFMLVFYNYRVPKWLIFHSVLTRQSWCVCFGSSQCSAGRYLLYFHITNEVLPKVLEQRSISINFTFHNTMLTCGWSHFTDVWGPNIAIGITPVDPGGSVISTEVYMQAHLISGSIRLTRIPLAETKTIGWGIWVFPLEVNLKLSN